MWQILSENSTETCKMGNWVSQRGVEEKAPLKKPWQSWAWRTRSRNLPGKKGRASGQGQPVRTMGTWQLGVLLGQPHGMQVQESEGRPRWPRNRGQEVGDTIARRKDSQNTLKLLSLFQNVLWGAKNVSLIPPCLPVRKLKVALSDWQGSFTS